MVEMKAPEGGTPELITDTAGLKSAISELASGSGPIAIDAERASGYRYSSRAYLIQLFRRSGGLHLIDPIPLADDPELARLAALIAQTESVIHASSQDLPCLRELGIDPKSLFDTELGGRIAGFERVGLGALCEALLGVSLAKEHSAVDWSIRPLRGEWLDYAALDVALLIDLRDAVAAALVEQGKMEWAAAEFAAALAAPPPRPKKDAWRRTSGMHQVKSRYEMALVRELWQERDRIAAQLDIAPGRLLSDLVIVELALRKPSDEESYLALPILKERIRTAVQKSHLPIWWQTLERAYQIDANHWPEARARGDGLPPPRVWRSKFPLAFAHLQNARLELAAIAIERKIPLENLIAPDVVKRLAFDGGNERSYTMSPALLDETTAQLEQLGARRWQIDLTAAAITRARTLDDLPEAPIPGPEASEE